MNASNVRTSSTPAAASSSLRPRVRRLISGLDEGDEATFDPANALSNRIASPVPSPLDSRAASPIPASRLSRPHTSHGANGSRASSSVGTGSGSRLRKTGNESPTLAGLWGNSWHAIQGIASDLLSGDSTFHVKDKPIRNRRPLSRLNSQRASTSSVPSQWGPAAPASRPTIGDVGAGTQEEQLAALRAHKRKDMLIGQGSSYANTLDKFKRRLSNDHGSMSAPPGENEDRDALVYLHHVKSGDTLAGITIYYNCSANVLRKANRMWPNDTVQSRETIILPVDACGVKGKPVPGPEALDLLTSESDALFAGQAEEVTTRTAHMVADGSALFRNRASSASTNTAHNHSSSVTTSISMNTSSGEGEPLWHHDSWVLLPGSSKPTEIVRVARRALGYFPPARRKSNCYSDLDTPSMSFDMMHRPTNDPTADCPNHQDFPQRPSTTRRPSNANNGYFPSYLAGPGGVGTMNKNVHFPGPAQDGLNKLFAKHLPDVAPPRTQQALLIPEIPLFTDQPTPVASSTTSPSHSNNLNLENVGGAIESWMRRVATQTKAAMTPSERQKAARTSVGTPGRGAGAVGDLIEMTNEFEIGDEEEDEDRGRRGSSANAGQRGSSSTNYFHGAVVRERSFKTTGKSGKAD